MSNVEMRPLSTLSILVDIRLFPVIKVIWSVGH